MLGEGLDTVVDKWGGGERKGSGAGGGIWAGVAA